LCVLPLAPPGAPKNGPLGYLGGFGGGVGYNRIVVLRPVCCCSYAVRSVWHPSWSRVQFSRLAGVETRNGVLKAGAVAVVVSISIVAPLAPSLRGRDVRRPRLAGSSNCCREGPLEGSGTGAACPSGHRPCPVMGGGCRPQQYVGWVMLEKFQVMRARAVPAWTRKGWRISLRGG
jgi:hypothetical protein